MKNDIILAGVGGQGILTIAAVVGRAAMAAGLNVKQSEVHGMAQRGGAVLAHLRLSDEPIYSDLIREGAADVLLAVEPMEALRHANMVAPDGVLLSNSVPVTNIEYPDLDEVIAQLEFFPRRVVLDADAMAREAGSARAMNMVMLGALSPFLAVDEDALPEAIRLSFERKGEEVVETNLLAYDAGRAASINLVY
ncbi:MAG: indolepyruvate oxidoreductase subunit beta [Lentisphaeria bacterium]|nr:indolepyruvate oxidoreductase subunit beta [Lentisphaeria bacterium]